MCKKKEVQEVMKLKEEQKSKRFLPLPHNQPQSWKHFIMFSEFLDMNL